jgi:hypothetical protein
VKLLPVDFEPVRTKIRLCRAILAGLGVVYAAWGYGPGVVFSVELYARLVGDTVNAIAVDAEGDAWIGDATTGAVMDYS